MKKKKKTYIKRLKTSSGRQKKIIIIKTKQNKLTFSFSKAFKLIC